MWDVTGRLYSVVPFWPGQFYYKSPQHTPIARPWGRVLGVFCKVNPDSKVHGGQYGPTGPRWAPCWSHELCYLGKYDLCSLLVIALLNSISYQIRLHYDGIRLYLVLTKSKWNILQDESICWRFVGISSTQLRKIAQIDKEDIPKFLHSHKSVKKKQGSNIT